MKRTTALLCASLTTLSVTTVAVALSPTDPADVLTAASASGAPFVAQRSEQQVILPGSVLTARQDTLLRVTGAGQRSKPKPRRGLSDQQLFAISLTGSNDVPDAALRAYRDAAATLAVTTPSCQIAWTMLAAIGRVESNHGRYGGSQLGSDGVSRPPIVGPRLDGAGPFAAIPDSEGGRLDGDKLWDRAVGPMQFLPTTWSAVARDGDGDGESSPNDLDDAAQGAAVYLCGAGNLSEDSGKARAAFRYNPSDYYVALVLAYERGYRTGVFAIPSAPVPPEDELAAEKAQARKDRRAKRRAAKLAALSASVATDKVKPTTPKSKPTPKASTQPTVPKTNAAPTPKPPHAPATPPPGPAPGPAPGSAPGSGTSPAPTPTPPPAPDPTPEGS